MWSILLVTLPTHPNAVRLRIWRALKTLGCAALRDGAYVLPGSETAALEALAVQVREHGGSASVLTLSPQDEAQKQEVLAQFDRADVYAAWNDSVKTILATYQSLSENDARRKLRTTGDALHDIERIDYYPNAAKPAAQAMMTLLRQAIEAQFKKGEPQAISADIEQLDAAKFQGKRWATRARPWVDRMASAWLIARFIDPTARFVWLGDLANIPKNLVTFDFDGARFTHVGERVTFEVLIASFGLAGDARLAQIAQAVHYLDAGGNAVVQAAGLEAVLAGLREVHAQDDDLIKATSAVFDALYANPGAPKD